MHNAIFWASVADPDSCRLMSMHFPYIILTGFFI